MEFLLELLTEELPASHIRAALEQIETGFRKELLDGRIEVGSLKVLATPRRLIVTADLAAGQADREETVTGPPLSIAKGPDGALTPARELAWGFWSSPRVRSCLTRSPSVVGAKGWVFKVFLCVAFLDLLLFTTSHKDYTTYIYPHISILTIKTHTKHDSA